jgi:Tfp pilus assembly protein PilO
MRNSIRERYLITRRVVQKAIREYNERPTLRAYLEILLTLTAISLFGIFAIRPTAKTIGNLLKEIKAKEDTIKVMNEKIDNLRAAQELYTHEEEKIKLLDEAIPQQPKPEDIAVQIDELAKTDGVIINSMSIQNVKIFGEVTDPDQNIDLKLSVRGPFLNLLNFTEGLENLRRPVKYSSIVITSEGAKESAMLDMVLNNLTTVYMR